jgi:hypothetical protein
VGERAAWLLGGAIVLALAATFFAPYFPEALGGPASYALVESDGMEPKLAAGDLAVFHTSNSYEVGDVVAYEARQGRAIARVIARRKAGYVVAQDVGDAPLRVSTRQITGSLEAVLPRAGAALFWLREPLHMLAVPAAAALLGVALLVAGGLRPRLAGGRNPRRDGPASPALAPVRRARQRGARRGGRRDRRDVARQSRRSRPPERADRPRGGRGRRPHLARERGRRRVPLSFSRPGGRRGRSFAHGRRLVRPQETGRARCRS